MSAISITPSAVFASTNAQVAVGAAGTTIVQGKALYIDTDNNSVLKLLVGNGASPANVFAGISLNSALVGQRIRYAVSDPSFTFGGTITAGEAMLAGGAGSGAITIARGDFSSGYVVSVIGSTLTTTTMNLEPVIPSGTLP